LKNRIKEALAEIDRRQVEELKTYTSRIRDLTRDHQIANREEAEKQAAEILRMILHREPTSTEIRRVLITPARLVDRKKTHPSA
jgi:hypothetical protein